MRTQNLACGLFELQPKDESEGVTISASRKGADSGAGASTDAAGDDDLSTLRLPSQQTAAVAAAKRAGRPLVSEVSSASQAPEDGPRPPGESERQRRKRTR